MPAAKAATEALKGVTAGLTQLNQAGQTKVPIEQTFITASASVDEFNAKVQNANAQIASTFGNANSALINQIPLIGQLIGGFNILANDLTASNAQFQQLTATQFSFAQAALATGTNLQTVKLAIDGTNAGIKDLEVRFSAVGEAMGASRGQLNAFEGAMLTAATSSQEGAAIAQAFANAVLSGQMSIEEATFKLQAYSIAIAENAARKQEAANASMIEAQGSQEVTTALGQEAIEAQNASDKTAQLKALQEGLANISGAVASGHITAANGAAQLAAQYNIATSEAERLISAQMRLAGLSSSGIALNAKRRGQEGGLLGNIGADLKQATASQKFLEDQERRQKDMLDAEVALARAKGNTRAEIDLLRKSQQGLNKDSAEYKKIEAQIIQTENAAEKRGKKKGTKAPKLTANEKINNTLLAQEDKFDQKMEDLERSHQQKLLDIIQEFNKKQQQTENENQILKRRSRFDFYSNLNKSSIAPIDKAKFSAAYEEAFSEAQKIAQSGRAKLSQEFLELRKKQIEELQQLAQEEADIKGAKDLSKKDKNAQLADLEARRKLLLDAQEEEKKQLLEGGDKNLNEFNQKIADENQAYEDQATKIATAAERSAEAKIKASERAKIKVSEENKELAKQVAIYDDINAKNGGKPATNLTTPPTTAAAPSTPVAVTDPVPIKTDTPLPVTLPPLVTVHQDAMFIVRDDGVIAAIGDQTVRLEGKLSELINSVAGMSNTLGSKIDGVRSAVGSIKLARP